MDQLYCFTSSLLIISTVISILFLCPYSKIFPFYCLSFQLYNFFGSFFKHLFICWDFMLVVVISSEFNIVCWIILYLFKHPCLVTPTSGSYLCWFLRGGVDSNCNFLDFFELWVTFSFKLANWSFCLLCWRLWALFKCFISAGNNFV